MNHDPSELENVLQRLQPLPLSAELLGRLDGAAAGTANELSRAEVDFEHHLRSTAAAPLNAGMLDSFASLTAGIVFPQDKNIVAFPPRRAASKSQPQRSIWAAAAAVALLGAGSAWWIPSALTVKNTATLAAQHPTVILPNHNTQVVPASFNRGLSEAHDEGVVWDNNRKPHSVVRATYMDRITVKDAQGRLIEVERPRVEYMLVPDKID